MQEPLTTPRGITMVRRNRRFSFTRWMALASTVLAIGVATGCGDDDSGAPQGSDSGGRDSGGEGGSGAGDTEAPCVTGDPCDCTDGEPGYLECADGSEEEPACNCEPPPPFEPDEAPEPFEACGGEPLGVWELTSYDATGTTRETLFGGCATRLDAQGTDGRWLIRFSEEGLIEGPGLQLLPVTWTTTSACLAAEKRGCAQQEYGTTCTSAEGLCTCETWVDVFAFLSPPWVQEEGSLSFENGAQYEYCVGENTLELRDGAGVRFTFERREVDGEPAPCAEREASECALGGHCRAGECSGSEECASLLDEFSCTNGDGCAWDAEICAGTEETCGLQDYGSVPGCTLGEPPSEEE